MYEVLINDKTEIINNQSHRRRQFCLSLNLPWSLYLQSIQKQAGFHQLHQLLVVYYERDMTTSINIFLRVLNLVFCASVKTFSCYFNGQTNTSRAGTFGQTMLPPTSDLSRTDC
jgi:hypothetical protein